MYPFLWEEVLGYNVAMYDLLTAIGVFGMLLYVGDRLEKKDGYTRRQANKILLFIVIGLGSALLFSALFDATFHWIEDGEFEFGSITFIGGLIGGVAMFTLLMRFFYRSEWKNIGKLLNTITVGILIAHAFGRLGCFCAGCCYGIESEWFGFVFPHGHSAGTGAVLPTQLYESAFLFLSAYAIHTYKAFKGREFASYLTAYGVFRFLLEFLRGDDRGSIIGLFTLHGNIYPSPSQYLSLAMVAIGVYLLTRKARADRAVPLKEAAA
jgi:phosphatidylglycerol:prolipoprotein diacylglycerol transferase